MRSTCLYLEAQRVVALRLRCAVSHLTPSSVTRRRSQRRCNICGAIGRRASSDIFSSRRSNVSASQYCGSSVVIAKGPIVVAKWWSVLVAQFGKFVRLGSKGRAWALRKGAPCDSAPFGFWVALGRPPRPGRKSSWRCDLPPPPEQPRARTKGAALERSSSLARYSTVPLARFVLEPARASPNALTLVVAATVLGVVLEIVSVPPGQIWHGQSSPSQNSRLL